MLPPLPRSLLDRFNRNGISEITEANIPEFIEEDVLRDECSIDISLLLMQEEETDYNLTNDMLHVFQRKRLVLLSFHPLCEIPVRFVVRDEVEMR